MGHDKNAAKAEIGEYMSLTIRLPANAGRNDFAFNYLVPNDFFVSDTEPARLFQFYSRRHAASLETAVSPDEKQCLSGMTAGRRHSEMQSMTGTVE